MFRLVATKMYKFNPVTYTNISLHTHMLTYTDDEAVFDWLVTLTTLDLSVESSLPLNGPF